jgi:hypothetical protein
LQQAGEQLASGRTQSRHERVDRIAQQIPAAIGDYPARTLLGGGVAVVGALVLGRLLVTRHRIQERGDGLAQLVENLLHATAGHVLAGLQHCREHRTESTPERATSTILAADRVPRVVALRAEAQRELGHRDTQHGLLSGHLRQKEQRVRNLFRGQRAHVQLREDGHTATQRLLAGGHGQQRIQEGNDARRLRTAGLVRQRQHSGVRRRKRVPQQQWHRVVNQHAQCILSVLGGWQLGQQRNTLRQLEALQQRLSVGGGQVAIERVTQQSLVLIAVRGRYRLSE